MALVNIRGGGRKVPPRLRRDLAAASQASLVISAAKVRVPSVASAATINLNYSTGEVIEISGNEAISVISPSPQINDLKKLRFTGNATLTHNASFIKIPGNISVTANAGDYAIIVFRGGTLWEVITYQSAFQQTDNIVPHPANTRLQVNGTTSIDCIPWLGNRIPLWNGSFWVSKDFSTLNIKATNAGPLTGDTTNGSPDITGITGDISQLVPGMRVDVSAGFAAGTLEVIAVVDSDSIRVNANATSDQSGMEMSNFVLQQNRVHDVYATLGADGSCVLRLGQGWDVGSADATSRGNAPRDIAGGSPGNSLGIELLQGIYVNSAALHTGWIDDNSIEAQRATYLGTIKVTGTHGELANTALARFVWNMYNRMWQPLAVLEATDTWTYSTASFRQANAAAGNKVEFVRGLDLDAISMRLMACASNSDSSNQVISVAIGLDSVTAPAAGSLYPLFQVNDSGSRKPAIAEYVGLPGLGYHYLAWLEKGAGGDTQTWFGDTGIGGGAAQHGLVGSGIF